MDARRDGSRSRDRPILGQIELGSYGTVQLARDREPASGYPQRVNDDLIQALESARTVRFLCSGNIVRSAFCELMGRQRGLPWTLDSAGTRFHNRRLYPETREALLERGLAPEVLDDFTPRHLDDLDDPPEGMVVLGMAEEHLAFWRDRWSTPAFRIAALLDETAHVADPVLEGASFPATFERLERCLDAMAGLSPGSSGSARRDA